MSSNDAIEACDKLMAALLFLGEPFESQAERQRRLDPHVDAGEAVPAAQAAAIRLVDELTEFLLPIAANTPGITDTKPLTRFGRTHAHADRLNALDFVEYLKIKVAQRGESDARDRRRRPTRRRSSPSHKPLTPRQTEAVERWSANNGTSTRAAKDMGISRAAFVQHLDGARRKMPGTVPDFSPPVSRTPGKRRQRLPTDNRGGEVI